MSRAMAGFRATAGREPNLAFRIENIDSEIRPAPDTKTEPKLEFWGGTSSVPALQRLAALAVPKRHTIRVRTVRTVGPRRNGLRYAGPMRSRGRCGARGVCRVRGR